MKFFPVIAYNIYSSEHFLVANSLTENKSAILFKDSGINLLSLIWRFLKLAKSLSMSAFSYSHLTWSFLASNLVSSNLNKPIVSRFAT